MIAFLPDLRKYAHILKEVEVSQKIKDNLSDKKEIRKNRIRNL
jgi:hypothetical protein